MLLWQPELPQPRGSGGVWGVEVVVVVVGGGGVTTQIVGAVWEYIRPIKETQIFLAAMWNCSRHCHFSRRHPQSDGRTAVCCFVVVAVFFLNTPCVTAHACMNGSVHQQLGSGSVSPTQKGGGSLTCRAINAAENPGVNAHDVIQQSMLSCAHAERMND